MSEILPMIVDHPPPDGIQLGLPLASVAAKVIYFSHCEVLLQNEGNHHPGLTAGNKSPQVWNLHSTRSGYNVDKVSEDLVSALFKYGSAWDLRQWE